MKFMKKIIIFSLTISIFIVVFVFQNQNKIEPGNAYPTMVNYNGDLYIHRGGITYDLPKDSELIGKVKKVETSSIKNNLDGNESGYLYKNNYNNLIIFEYETWDIENNGKKPYLLLQYQEK